MKLERFSAILILFVIGILLSPTVAWALNESGHHDNPAVEPDPLPSVGRLLLAPSVDADGDPATNPVAGRPAPVLDLLGEPKGLVTLAAQLQPHDPGQTPIGVPVTFRLWNQAGLQIERAVRSDAWGAVGVQIYLDEIEGLFFYQADAPGYGQTEVRQFRFDPSQPAYVLHAGGAQLWYWRQGAGRVLITLRSPLPLQAGRDQARLIVARRPEWNDESTTGTISPLLQATQQAGLRAPFPPVEMQVVGTYTATAELQLPPGDYHFLGSVMVNQTPTEHFNSQTLHLEIRDQAAPPPTLAIWASELEYEPGYRLVRYRDLAGRTVFDLLPTDQLPDVQSDWQGNRTFTKRWRIGPFQWLEERYEIRVETVVDDGKKVVSLTDLDYDPIARRYTLAIHSLHDQTISDTLRLDVLGPGGVVIKHEESQVVLQPGQVLHYSIEVPAELGQPEGLHIVLEDPLDTFVRDLVAACRTLDSFIRSYGSMTGELKLSSTILSYEFISAQYKTPPDSFEFNFIPSPDLEAIILEKLGEFFGGELVLGSASLEITIDLEANFTLREPECLPDSEKEIFEQNLKDIATLLNDWLGKISHEWVFDDVKVPVWWIIQFWLKSSVSISGAAEAEGLTLSLETEIQSEMEGKLGIKLDFMPPEADKLWKMVTGTYELIEALRALEDLMWQIQLVGQCDPDPPDERPPDDRQDVWQGVESFYRGEDFGETIDNLNGLIARAQEQELGRAERLLTLRLRETELASFTSNTQGLLDYLQRAEVIGTAVQADLQGIISGTIPISPSQTITEALAVRIDQGMADLNGLPHVVQQQQLLDRFEIAQQRYLELRGQELELQHELRKLFLGDAIGVLASGFAEATLAALDTAGLPGQLISPWPFRGTFRGRPAPYVFPHLAPRTLVVPSGGMHVITNSPEARAWLDEYVRGGGLLIVFSQPFGDDWSALPGGELHGLGYEEDQRWQQASVQAAAPSNWLVWMGVAEPDIQIDGVFTAWPPEAKLLLKSTTGPHAGYPVMLEYPHGQGSVLATTAYGDWAWQTGFWWGDDWQMTRAVLIRAYLLTQGRDVDDLLTAEPASTVQVTFPITNTSTFSTSHVTVFYPETQLGWRWWWPQSTVTVPLTLAPGENGVVEATLGTPYVLRRVHNWTQIGLYHLRAQVALDNGQDYILQGPFVHVTSPVLAPDLETSLVAGPAASSWYQTVAVTATVENHAALTRTVALWGLRDLPSAPVTLTVPAEGRADHVYSLVMDRSKRPQARFQDAYSGLTYTANVDIQVAYPNLQARTFLPPVLVDGATITATVTNLAPYEWELGGSLALSLTAPSGVPLWTADQVLPPLGAGETITSLFDLSRPPLAELGTYQWLYKVDNGAGLSRLTPVPLPAEPLVHLTFEPPTWRVRQPLTLTIHLANDGHFALEPTVSITVPVLGLTRSQQLSLPAGGQAAIPINCSLPGGLSAGSYPVQVSLEQGTTLHHTFNFVLPSPFLEPALEPGPYAAGETLTVTLSNQGGVDTVADYSFKLGDDVGQLIASSVGTRTVMAGSHSPLTPSLPSGLATGDYRLLLIGKDQNTQQSFRLRRTLDLEGVAGAMNVHTEQPNYLEGQIVRVQGWVTATQGVLSGTLDLGVTCATEAASGTEELVDDGLGNSSAASIAADAGGDAYATWTDDRNGDDDVFFAYRPAMGSWSTGLRVNDDGGSTDQGYPQIALDGAGNAYAVWEDQREGNGDIYFAYKLVVSDTWSTNIKVNDDSGTALQIKPAIAVDGTGNAYVVWEDGRNGNWDVYFAYKAAISSTWSANVRVDDDTGGNWQTDPDIAVDGNGNLYAVWRDRRNDNGDVYFAYRAVVSDTWSANLKINDDMGSGWQERPSIAVDPSGNAYAVWEDDRGMSDGSNIYFSHRPSGGSWGLNEWVNAESSRGEGYYVFYTDLAVDNAGNAYAVWGDEDGLVWTYDVYFGYRPAGGLWGGDTQLNDRGDGSINSYKPAVAADEHSRAYVVWESDDGRIHFSIVGDDPGLQTVWQQQVSIDTSTTQAISETVGLLDVSQCSKYWLSAEMRSAMSQTLATSRQSFYVFPLSTALTLETDRPIYVPGQIATVSGWVTNTSSLSTSLMLTLTANSQPILTRSLTLSPAQGSLYSTTLLITENLLLVATADAAQATEWVATAAPKISATLDAPEAVGYQPFSATLSISNTGDIPVATRVRIAEKPPAWLTLAPGQVSQVAHSLTLTGTSLVTATLRGDVSLDLSQLVLWGLGGQMSLAPPDADTSGLISIDYALTGTGPLPTPAQLTCRLDAGPIVSQSLTLWPGQTFSNSLELDVPPGRHTLLATLQDQTGQVLDQASLPLVLLPASAPLQPSLRLLDVTITPSPLAAGQPFSLTLGVANDGPAGPAIVDLTLFDTRQQWIITPTGWLTQSFSFDLMVPADLPADEYFGQLGLDQHSQALIVEVVGTDLAMSLALDRPHYRAGSLVTLTVALTDTAGLSADYLILSRYLGAEDYVTVTVLANQAVDYTFNFSAAESARATVFLAQTPSPGYDRRVLTLDSLPVPVVDPADGAYLTHNKLVYEPGDTLYLSVTVTSTFNSVVVLGPIELALQADGFLLWTPPEDETTGLVLTGTYSLSYTLPTGVPMGRYTFVLHADEQRQSYPVDVRGYKVTTRHVMLDKPRYARQDELAATLEFWNEGDQPIDGLSLRAWLLAPDDGGLIDLSPPVSRTVDLQPGLNALTVTGAFSTPLVGPHRLLVNVGPGCCGWRLAGASTQLDVGWAHLVALSTDHGDYAPGQPGIGQLDAYGWGSTRLIVTATNGSTLLDAYPDLSGFGTFTFSIPTTPTGNYLLVANSMDRNGDSDRLVRAYAVPEPPDWQPPTLRLTFPHTYTVIVTPAPTSTLAVTGEAADESGQVTVLLNGISVTPAADGRFTQTLEIHQGFNPISAVALDPAGNITYTPMVPVYLVPAWGMGFSLDRETAQIGQRVTWQTVLTSSGPLSDVILIQPLPSAWVTQVLASASSGHISLNGLSPAWRVVEWQGDLSGQPVTVTVEAGLQATGTLETAATTYWGWGFSDERETRLTVTAPEPAISLSPTSLGVTLNPGDAATRTLTLHNPGDADLIWNLSELPPQTWLSSTPLSGTLSPSSAIEIVVSFDANGLAAGVYTSTLQIDSNAPSAPSVAVALTVTAECVPVSGAAFIFTPTAPTVNQTLTLTGTVVEGTPSVLYTWDLGDGQSKAGQTITHTYALSATYTVVLTATNCSGAGLSTQRRDIVVVAQEPSVYTVFLPIVLKKD